LFAVTSSVSLATTVAVLLTVVAIVGVTAIVIVVLAEADRSPTLHVTVPLLKEHDPWVVLAETKVKPFGRTSVACTPVAGDGPWLVTFRE
jgi:hypothetical protein